MQDNTARRIMKITAAKRQIDAAIRMLLSDEDLVAITTLGAAAYRILRDLRAHEGHPVLENLWKTDVVGVARALARNELSEREIGVLSHDSAWDLIQSVATFVREVGTDLSMEELCVRVTLNVPPDFERKYWKHANRIPNFLKHADSDPYADIAEQELEPREMILRSVFLFSDLGGDVSPEMQVWYALELCSHTDIRPDYEPIATMIQKFEITPALMRKELASEVIEALKALHDGARVDKIGYQSPQT
jgi:hypothetical protein